VRGLRRLAYRLATRSHVFVYRLSGGAIGGGFGKAPVLLLTTRGRRTGKAYTTPLLYLRDGSRLIVVASSGGADRDPQWWRNLKTHPEASVQVKRDSLAVRAEQASAEEKQRLWPLLVQMYKPYQSYQERTAREIPVVVLNSAGPTPPGPGPAGAS